MGRVVSYPLDQFRRVMRSGYPTSPTVLAGTRIAFCLYFVTVGVNKTAWLGAVPDELFDPPNGVPQLFSGFPPESVGLAIDIIGVLLLIAVGVGWRTRTNSYLLFTWSIVANAMVFSLGKVDHTFLSWLLVPLFATAGWGDRLSIDSMRRTETPDRPTWPVPAMAFMLAFGFMTAAIPKLLRGWTSPASQATEGYFREAFVTQERTAFLATDFYNIDSVLFWEFLDVWTIIFEFAVGIGVLWPRFFRWTLVQASVFHIAVLFIMNIPIILMMLIYIPIIAGRWATPDRAPERDTPKWPLAVLAGTLTTLGALGLFGPWARFRLTSALGIESITFLAVVGLAMFVGVLLTMFWRPTRTGSDRQYALTSSVP